MRRGAPLAQQNEKAPVVSTHPDDVPSLDYGTAYDKTQKSGQTSGSSRNQPSAVAVPPYARSSTTASSSTMTSSAGSITSGTSIALAKQLPTMESMTIGSQVYAGTTGLPPPSSYPTSSYPASYSEPPTMNASHAYRHTSSASSSSYTSGSTSGSTSSRHNRIAHAFLTKHDPALLQILAIGTIVGALILYFILPLTASLLVLVFGAVVLGVLCSLWLSRSVLEKDDGTAEMRAVSDPIREGAEGFLRVQYSVSFTFLQSLFHKIPTLFCNKLVKWNNFESF